MKYTSYLALVERFLQCPQIAEDRQLFAGEMAAISSDEKGYAALLAAVGTNEIHEIKRVQPGMNLSEEQRMQNLQTAWKLYARLAGEGIDTYAALWAANCWGNALSWPICLTDERYMEWIQALPQMQMEALAGQGDGYAAAALARICEENGDAQSAARWYKTAFDCCNVMTMRWMERQAQENAMSKATYEDLTMRHASLGDAEGMAAYALYLLEQGTPQYAEKALSLALCSAEMQCPAGQYALYKCMSGADVHGDGLCVSQEAARSIHREAIQQLDLAAEGGYPRAALERGMRRDAEGEYDGAYEDLLMAATDTLAYAAVWDGAYLIARYFLEGKGGAAQDESQAYLWAECGARHDCAAAMGMCGAMQMMGVGTQQDLRAGAEIVAAAAQRGDMDSVYRLSLMYRFGTGVEEDHSAADEFAARCVNMGEESADGLGFDWIKTLAKRAEAELQREESAEYPEEHTGIPDEEKWLEMGQARQPELETECEEELNGGNETAQEVREAPVLQQDEAYTAGVIEMLWPYISGILSRVDQEMIDATGEPAPDAALVDVLLSCLCGAMAVCASDEQKRAAYNGMISAFDSLMPGFAEGGFDEAYLHEEFAAIAEAINGYRAGYEELLAQQGRKDDKDWMQKCEIECALVYEIIGQVVQLDTPAQERIRAEVFRMLHESKNALLHAP